MRPALFVVGIVLAILGAVLIVVPLLPSASNFTATSLPDCSTPNCTVPYNIYSASPLMPTYAKLSWTSPTTVDFDAVTCSNDVSSSELDHANTSSEFQADCGTEGAVANGSGTSGSYSLTIPAGGSLVYRAYSFTPAAPQVSATLTGTEPLLGLVVLVLGIILLILGVVLRSKKQRFSRISSPIS